MTAPFQKPEASLIVLGHGSTENEDSSTPTHEHVEQLRERGAFRDVHAAFWKEEPSFRQIDLLTEAKEIYVVPNFISEGYFTRDVIPRELGLTGRTTDRNGKRIHYCDPVGIHESMTSLILEQAREVMDAPDEDSCLIIVGHGTKLNAKSTEAIKSQVERIRKMKTGFREVLDAYMEEPPLITDWASLTEAGNVVVVPFFHRGRTSQLPRTSQ